MEKIFDEYSIRDMREEKIARRETKGKNIRVNIVTRVQLFRKTSQFY